MIRGCARLSVDARVSQVAGHADVRAAMREAQRRFLSEGDTVAEGRDVGAVVWPDSELKVWLDADPVERARRRTSTSRATSPRRPPSTRAISAMPSRRCERPTRSPSTHRI